MTKQTRYLLLLALIFFSFSHKSLAQAPPTGCYLVNPTGDSVMSIKTLQEQTELKSIFGKFKVVSFVFYVTCPGFMEQPGIVVSNTAVFRKDLLELIRRLKGQCTVVFDEIKAVNRQGIIIGLESLVIHVR